MCLKSTSNSDTLVEIYFGNCTFQTWNCCWMGSEEERWQWYGRSGKWVCDWTAPLLSLVLHTPLETCGLTEGLHSQTSIGFGLKVLFSAKLVWFFFLSFRRCALLFILCFFPPEDTNRYSCVSLQPRITSFDMERYYIFTLSFFLWSRSYSVHADLYMSAQVEERKKAKSVLGPVQKWLKKR